MASQKRPRSGSGQGRSSGTATKPGSGNANGRAAVSQGQNARNQNGQPRNGRPQNSRAATLTAEASAGKAAETRFSAPTWVQWTSLVLSLAGLGMSIYMTIAHYTSTNILVCSNKGYIDCAKVTTSPESKLFGIFPVAELGLAFYVFMALINTPWAWRPVWNWLPRRLGQKLPRQLPLLAWRVRFGSMIVGILFVLYLIYTELITLRNLCLWCTSVHIITFLLFVTLLTQAIYWGDPRKALADSRA